MSPLVPPFVKSPMSFGWARMTLWLRSPTGRRHLIRREMPVRATGPYTFASGPSAGRKYMSVWYPDGSRGTTLYSRYLLEQQFGRRLDPNLETVDHINGDKTDDRIENLQVLSRVAHAAKDHVLSVMGTFQCPICGKMFERSMRRVRDKLQQGKRGPYCSRSCAAKSRY